MFHIINQTNRSLYEPQLEDMHIQRKKVFVDRLGWPLKVRDGGEYDEFDDELATYIVGFADDGRVAISIRLRRADHGSVLGKHFPHLIAPGERPLDDGKTFEYSRLFVEGRYHEPHVRAGFRIAYMENVLAAGGDRLVAMTDVALLPHAMEVGWKFRILGLPAPYPGGNAIAIEVPVNEAAIEDLRQMWGIRHGYVELTPELCGDVPVMQIEALLSTYETMPVNDRVVLTGALRGIGNADQRGDRFTARNMLGQLVEQLDDYAAH